MFDEAFTVGGVGAVAAVADAAVPGTRGFATPPPLNEGFAESGFGFWMVAEGVVPATPLGSVLAVLVKDLGRGATLLLLALVPALDAVDVAVAVEELTALVVLAGTGLKLENAREGEMSERVGATRATGALMDPVRRYVGAAAAAAAAAVSFCSSFSAMTLVAGFGGAGRCGLRGIGGSCSSACADCVALPEYIESPPFNFSNSLTISPSSPMSLPPALLARLETRSLRLSVCAAGGISSMTE